SKKLDLDNLLGQHGTVRTPVSQPVRKEREVRHLSPGEYIVVISMILTSLYLLVTSFFPLVYNIATSFEPVNFLMNLFYFILGIGSLAGAFLVLKKETHLEHIADDTFDEVVYKRLEPVLRDVADVQVGLTDVHTQLEMINLNIEKIGQVREQPVSTAAVPAQTSMYIKYVVLINITLATFLFMLQYPLEYIPYAVTVVFIIWWLVITQEFKLWNVESVWMWVFIPILILPVYTIIMNAYLRDYQMFGSLFIGLCAYVIVYYSWCSNMVRGVLPFDLHIALAEFKKKLKEKTPEEAPKTGILMPRVDLKIPLKLSLYQLGISMVIGSIILFASAWFGFSIQNGLIPNVTWEALGLKGFVWKPLYSYALTFFGMVLLGVGYSMVLKFRRAGY
ncbi:MAG: hypothetical protein Q8N79_00740, partial [Candidatus Methanoperedens sp.]|nr:hypothetical protein [Candidatus Methanoperedens sp.]